MSGKWFRYAPVILLCGVATWQINRAHHSDLTPWKGGGFGMFSTVDAPNARYVKIYFVRGEERIPVRLPESKADWLRRVKSDPSQTSLDQLADYLITYGVDRLWNFTDQPPLAIPGPSSAGAEAPLISGVPAEELRVEIWRLSYDRTDQSLAGSGCYSTSRPLDSTCGDN